MFLNGPDARRVALCYSMNVHPGENLEDQIAALEMTVAPLKARLEVEGPFAVGLRLSARAAEEAVQRAEELRTILNSYGLVAVTANVFPYGDFHAARVKEQVYAPDWTAAARAVYTLRAAVALAAVNEQGAEVSLSTVPLSFRAFSSSRNAMIGRLLEMISLLRGVEQKSGVRARLALEPEPFCVLETGAETIAFWRDQLMPACRAKYGRGAEELARTYLGICLDTCHHAVRWEQSAQVLDAYLAAGVPVAKMQVSSALQAPSTRELVPFDEPRYLHQVVSQSGEGRPDLPGPDLEGPLRCHFHVPIHLESIAGLETTAADTRAGLRRALETHATDCLEIETYTWDVLPQKEGALIDSLEAEYRWTLGVAAAQGYS